MAKLPVYDIADFSVQESESVFYANDLKTHLQNHQFVNQPHRHSTYITILFTKGNGEHLIDFNLYKVKPGSVFLLSPGQAHSWKLSSDADGFVFFHTEEFYNSVFIKKKMEDLPFYFLSSNYPVIYCNSIEINKIEYFFIKLISEFRNRYLYREAKLVSLVDIIYTDLSRLYDTNEEVHRDIKGNYFKVKSLLKLIDSDFVNMKSASDYADKLNMTTRHLSRICQEVLNKTTTQLIAERIILEAKRLLIHQDVSIASISDQIGFEDYSYFVRFFKKQVGKTPKEFQLTILDKG